MRRWIRSQSPGFRHRREPHPAAKPAFGEAYSKEGVSYTVLKGDSLGAIAKKTGAKAQDIIDANKIMDPSKIQVGQVLFVPGGK
jgi:LysM repeat protein